MKRRFLNGESRPALALNPSSPYVQILFIQFSSCSRHSPPLPPSPLHRTYRSSSQTVKGGFGGRRRRGHQNGNPTKMDHRSAERRRRQRPRRRPTFPRMNKTNVLISFPPLLFRGERKNSVGASVVRDVSEIFMTSFLPQIGGETLCHKHCEKNGRFLSFLPLRARSLSSSNLLYLGNRCSVRVTGGRGSKGERQRDISLPFCLGRPASRCSKTAPLAIFTRAPPPLSSAAICEFSKKGERKKGELIRESSGSLLRHEFLPSFEVSPPACFSGTLRRLLFFRAKNENRS